jgi:hypothetical protein
VRYYFGTDFYKTIIAGDINGDCKVDFADFAILAIHKLEKKRKIKNFLLKINRFVV